MEGEPTVGKSISLNNPCSELPVFDGSSPVTSVYKRRKFQKEPSTCFLSRITSTEFSEEKSYVYQRKKPNNRGKSIFPLVSENTKLNDQSDAATLLKSEKQVGHETRNESEAARSSIVCRDEPVLTRSGGCLADGDVEDELDKIVEHHNNYDDDGCCSSSTVNMNAETGTSKPDADQHSDCSSSGAFNEDVVGQYNLEKDLCVSILRKQGLLSTTVVPNMSKFDSTASRSGAGPSLSCNICSHPDPAVKMLICDDCEEAFHRSCCSRPTRGIDNDEWFCLSCFEKKKTTLRKSTVTC